MEEIRRSYRSSSESNFIVPYNYNKITQCDRALPQPVFVLIFGLLLGCAIFAYSNLSAAADRQSATQDSITARPTVNRFDFANDALRELLRDPSLTLTTSARQSNQLQRLNHANAPYTRGFRHQPKTATGSADSRAPNVAGWKKIPTVRTFEVPPDARSRTTRLPPSQNWKPTEPNQRSGKPSTDRTKPARPASTQRKTRKKRKSRAISRKKEKKKIRPTNWQNEVLFED